MANEDIGQWRLQLHVHRRTAQRSKDLLLLLTYHFAININITDIARSGSQPIPIPIGNHKPSSHHYRQIGNYDSYWAKPG